MKVDVKTKEVERIINKISLYDDVLVHNNFTSSIKNIINKSGCSQNQLARAIEVDKSTFSKMINRTRKIKKILLLKICKFLQVASDIAIELFDYNGTSIKTDSLEDKIIRGLLRSHEINTLKKTNEIIKNLEIDD